MFVLLKMHWIISCIFLCVFSFAAHCEEFHSVGFTKRDIIDCRCTGELGPVLQVFIVLHLFFYFILCFGFVLFCVADVVHSRKVKKCPKPLIPTNHMKKQALKFCLCCQTNKNSKWSTNIFCLSLFNIV